MTKDDQQEQLDKIMSANLSRAIDFVKFAETKNGALLTFCSAWIIALTGLLHTDTPLPPSAADGAKLALPFFAIAALLAVLSFIPITSIVPFRACGSKGQQRVN
ncbi:hypothetical protein EOS_32240 [Caballeronia mineralivorans PML1(12)]|uniref:Pycsar effector protein domain-containing protein n=1 Tax=Caballeronia mineralivorans PML1(12) TaxID=908627 RepID=A0A0J1FQW5_9BURK|nr:hypothetical protein [Caballeronia mineralivorans]KLU22128.1 hypothetical protein EOS_32240 [Caballeronia mineralivorans PML1(12)]